MQYNEIDGERWISDRWEQLNARLLLRHNINKYISLSLSKAEHQATVTDFSRRWYAVLKSRMTESQRAYHTLEHLFELFQHLDRVRDHINDVDIVELAIFFHDIVYETRGYKPGQNEEESAEMFLAYAQEYKKEVLVKIGNFVESGLDWKDVTEKVEQYIRATAKHDHQAVADKENSDGNWFLDLDLLILAANEERYSRYTSQVRHEYTKPHGVFDNAQFVKGRSGFLSSFLAKDQRFYRMMDDETEKLARKNMSKELMELNAELERIKEQALQKSLFLWTAVALGVSVAAILFRLKLQ